jgi:hypothetical protein
MMIQRAKTRAEISHGRAAKLINVYLKAAAFVCGGYHEHPKVTSLHPLTDRLLLQRMSSERFGERDDWKDFSWTKLNSEDYQGLIDRIRTASRGQPLWKIECFWAGF